MQFAPYLVHGWRAVHSRGREASKQDAGGDEALSSCHFHAILEPQFFQ